jgi:uncharacterized membrane protein YqhA
MFLRVNLSQIIVLVLSIFLRKHSQKWLFSQSWSYFCFHKIIPFLHSVIYSCCNQHDRAF